MPKAANRKPKKAVAKHSPQPKKATKRKPKEKRAMAKNEGSDLPDPKGKSGPGSTPGTPEKDPKDKPETAGIPKDPDEDPNEKKNTPPPHKQPNTPNTIHNRDQDPNHPANRTLANPGDPSPRPVAEGVTVPPDELLTEQEKEAAGSGGDPRAGVGPYEPSRSTPGPAKTIEDEGIGPRTPYPTGNPPPPSVSAGLSQGIWRGDEDERSRDPRERRDQSIRDAMEEGKDDYHPGDTVVDGPHPEEARRKRDEENQKRARDSRLQQRVGGPQERAEPPKAGRP